MTYPTLMAHLELGHSNAGLLRIAGELADQFEAGVIGIAACQPMRNLYSNFGDYYISGDIVQQERDEIEKEIKVAEAELRSALEGRSTVMFGSLCDYLACQARTADLIVTVVDSGDLVDASRRVSTAELVMHAGRPVLIVPRTVEARRLDRVVIGWKDTREARRAALDALPLLKKARHVAVVQIAAGEDLASARAGLDDVLGWLKRRGVEAEAIAAPSTGDDAARLKEIADKQKADLIVAGAYGHTRLREWVLGGMTRDLLLCADRCALVSH